MIEPILKLIELNLRQIEFLKEKGNSQEQIEKRIDNIVLYTQSFAGIISNRKLCSELDLSFKEDLQGIPAEYKGEGGMVNGEHVGLVHIVPKEKMRAEVQFNHSLPDNTSLQSRSTDQFYLYSEGILYLHSIMNETMNLRCGEEFIIHGYSTETPAELQPKDLKLLTYYYL